jgi:hypothetical protein
MPSPSPRGEAEDVAMMSIPVRPATRMPSGHAPGRMPAKRLLPAKRLGAKGLGAIVALWAALAACPALAQEANAPSAPAAGADSPQAGGGPGDSVVKGAAAAPDGAATTNSRDIEPVTPMRGAAGLQRRANLKGLIANAPPRPAGAPAGYTRVGPLPAYPAAQAATARNAIGVPIPGAKPPGHDSAGIASQARAAGIGTAGIGTAPGSAGSVTHQMQVPANAGAALRGAGVNGTAMGHVASGPAPIGGPARDRSGINGTLMRRKF